MRAIDARPMKKIAEAKARKKVSHRFSSSLALAVPALSFLALVPAQSLAAGVATASEEMGEDQVKS